MDYQIPEPDRPRAPEETRQLINELGLHERRVHDCLKLIELGARSIEHGLGEMVIGLYRDKEYYRKIALQYLREYGPPKCPLS